MRTVVRRSKRVESVEPRFFAAISGASTPAAALASAVVRAWLVLAFVPLVATACGSGTVGGVDDLEPTTGADAGDAADAVAAPDDVLASDAPAASDAGEDAAPACGVIACDESKILHPKIRAAYERHGGAPQVGEPVDPGGTPYVHRWGKGNVQDFDGGALGKVILAEADASEPWAEHAYAVHGPIHDAWQARGGAASVGYPKEDAHDGPGGRVQTFENGCIGPDGAGGYEVFEACDAPPDLGPVLAQIAAKSATSTPGTDFGIAVEWLPTGARWGHRASVARTSASSAKWFWAAAALSKASIATVEPKAIPTFQTSDNYTAGDLIDLAGGPNAVNDFTTKTLGIPIGEISLCRWSFGKTRVATNCSNALGGDNFFTPNGAVSFLAKLWRAEGVAADDRGKLLEWATKSPRSGYGGWVGTQLPSAARPTVSHKAGWLPTGCCSAGYPPHYNDIAIVRTSRGAYAVVLSMKGGTDSKIIETMEWSSCVIFHALARDVADPFGACTAP